MNKAKKDRFLIKLSNEIGIWESRRRIEDSPLGGNVVKAAQYGGTAAGLKIGLDMFVEFITEGEDDAKT